MEYPGEKLAIKMWETLTEKGIGGLLRPWQIRREGRAMTAVRRDELLLLAQAERDAADIRVGVVSLDENGRLLPPLRLGTPAEVAEAPEVPAPREIAKAIEAGLIADTLRREVNVAKAILVAEETLEGASDAPPDQLPDDDWLFRWRDAAGGVSEAELQRLWGNLLAGEFVVPGRYSLRTLEFLKNLSRKEALDIAELARFVIKGVVHREKGGVLDEEGIDMAFLLSLQSIGIVSGVDSIGLGATWSGRSDDRFQVTLPSNGKLLVVKHENPEETLKLPAYPVSDLGLQIMTLGSFEPHLPYLERVAEVICADGFEVFIADILASSGDRMTVGDLLPMCHPDDGEDQDSAHEQADSS